MIFDLSQIQGIDESIRADSLSPDKLTELENAVIDGEFFKVRKRFGFTEFNKNGFATEGFSLFTVRNNAGTEYVLAGVGVSPSTSSTLKSSLSGTSAWTDVKTGLALGARLQITGNNGEHYLTNGADYPFVVRGDALTTTENLTIDKPDISNVKSGHSPVPGYLTANANYKYVLVYVSKDGSLSIPSDPFTHHLGASSAHSTDGTNTILGFTDLPVSTDSRVTSKIIFRTKGNAEVYYKHSQIDNSVTTLDDDTLDTELDTTIQLEYVLDFNTAGYIEVAGNRLILGNLNINEKNYIMPALALQGGIGGSYSDGVVLTGTSNLDGAGGMTAGTYKYRFVYRDFYDTISDYTEITAVVDAGDDSVYIENLPTYINDIAYGENNYGIIELKIYRTKVNGSTFYEHSVRDYDTESQRTFTDIIADSALTVSYDFDQSKNYTSHIVVSALEKMPQVSVINFIGVYADDNEAITGILNMEDYLLIFKEKSICAIYNIKSSPETWSIVKLYDKIGCNKPETITKIGNDVYFGQDNSVYKFPALEEISLTRKNSFKAITEYYNSYYFDNYYIISAKDTTNLLLLYDLKLRTWYKFRPPVDFKAITSIGTTLLCCGEYLFKYAEDTYVDTVATVDTAITILLKTKRFIIDGITQIRLRKLYLSYYRTNNLSIIIEDRNGTQDTYTDGIGGTGQRTARLDILNSNDILLTDGFMLIIQSSGIRDLNNIRIDYYPIERIIYAS